MSVFAIDPSDKSSGERRKHMTARPRPAGWYPDPTGVRGQKYWDGGEWEKQDLANIPAVAGHGPEHSPDNGYQYKNPVLYALGGIILPPLVLFLMGGSRTACAWMVGLWILFWITVWVMGLGAIFAVILYIWSVAACYKEAIQQNQARGLA
jgi:Protein of unknown function (DUF2510)